MSASSGGPAVPIPADERARLAAVRSTGLLDAAPVDLIDTVTDLVAAALGVPIACVTLVDEDRLWFASRHGLDVVESPREGAFCAHAIVQPDQLLVVDDASRDDRFASSSLVTGPPGARFYAGSSVRAPDGQPVGSLCVIDTEPRRLGAGGEDLLRRAARQVEALLSVRIEREAGMDGQDRTRSLPAESRHAAEARTRFLAVAQHKLKTPMAVINGWSAMLKNWELLEEEERIRGLDAINRSTVELQAQIDDLLDEARSHVLEQTIDLEPIELGALLDEQVSALRFDVERHPIHLEVDDDLWVRADGVALRHVLAHLLDNAVKYSPGGGAITVSASIDGDRVAVAVRDQGIGLPEDVDVFEPFQRGATATGVARGTGLGLYIVRSLMTSMHGDVRATSPGAGTSIELSLPMA